MGIASSGRLKLNRHSLEPAFLNVEIDAMGVAREDSDRTGCVCNSKSLGEAIKPPESLSERERVKAHGSLRNRLSRRVKDASC